MKKLKRAQILTDTVVAATLTEVVAFNKKNQSIVVMQAVIHVKIVQIGKGQGIVKKNKNMVVVELQKIRLNTYPH